MAVVNLKFRNNTVQLVSDEPEKLVELSERLNMRMEGLQQQGQFMTDAKLAYMAALILESEVDTLKASVSDESQSAKSSEQLDAALSKTINQVADYINHLADKFEKN